MTLIVSVGELKNNISEYLGQVLKGARLLIRDEKKGKNIAQITQTFSFDKHSYGKALLKAAGIFLSKNHPQWKTKSNITSWVKKQRLANDRTF